MATLLSLPDLVASLESQLAVHQESQTFHTEELRKHEEQRAHHAAEIETITRKLATFRAALAEVEDLEAHFPAAKAAPNSSQPSSGKLYVARMVADVLEGKTGAEPFGISIVTAEVNRRYGDRLRKPVTQRQVSNVLRWMLRSGRLRSVSRGRPFHEAMYAKE